MVHITLIFAEDLDGVIGRDGDLPWRLPDELRRFKRVTMGKPMIMGRRTHASIGRVLPGRKNIVLSRDPAYQPAEGCVGVAGVDEALREVGDAPEVMIIGGRGVYEAFLPRATRVHRTVVQARVGGDVRLSAVDWSGWREVEREEHPADARHAHAYIVTVLERDAEGFQE